MQQHEAYMRVLVRELVSPQPETKALVMEAVAPLVAEVSAVIAAAQAGGEVGTERPAPMLAMILLGQLTMAYVQHWASDGVWPTWEELPSLCVGMFLDGCGA